MPVDHPTAGNESRSQPGSKRYHDEIPHSPGIAVSDLPESGGIGVVGNTDGNPGKRVADLLAKREKPPPFLRIRLSGSKLPEIDRTLDPARMIVGIRSTDPDTRQYSPGRHRRTKLPQRPYEHFDISRIVVNIRVLLGRDDRFGIEVAVFIHEAESGVDAADVYADREFFHIVFQVKS